MSFNIFAVPYVSYCYSLDEWEEKDDDDVTDIDDFVGLVNEDHEIDYSNGLDQGWYDCVSRSHWRSMSMRSIREFSFIFKENLAEVIYKTKVKDILENRDKYSDKPFYELFCWDNHYGFWGPEVCKNILEDFKSLMPITTMGLSSTTVLQWIILLEHVGDKGVLLFV